MASTQLVYGKRQIEVDPDATCPETLASGGIRTMPFRLEMNVTPVSSSAMFCSVDLGDHRVHRR